jgi:signal peptidase I
MSEDRPASFLFQQFVGELITSGYAFRFQARGRSMLPTIRDGEILHVEPVIARGPAIGHIVLLRKGEEFRTHRIVRKRGDLFVTRGDAGLEDDGEIPRGRILGLVVAKQCSITGRTIRLDNFPARARYFLRELHRGSSSLLSKFQRAR